MHGTAKELQVEIDKIVAHYMDICAWREYSANRLTKKGAALYVTQHGVFTRHSRRCWAYVVGQCPETDVRRLIVRENLYEEEGIEAQSHYLKLVKMGVACGHTSEQVHNAKALPSTRAALLIWEELCKDRPWIIGCAAKASLEQTNQVHCSDFSNVEGQRWMNKLGLSHDEVEFWMMHDELDKEHGSGAFEAVTRYVGKVPGVTEDDVLMAVEDSMVAFNIFLDGIAKEADKLK